MSFLSKFFGASHKHEGVGKDGSSQIDYSSILNTPEEYVPPTRTAISATATANKTINNATWTALDNLDTTSIDTKSEFNTANGTFTAKEDGRYLLTGNCATQYGTSNTGFELCVPYINGVLDTSYGSQEPVYPTTDRLNFSFTLNLSAGDYVQIGFYQNSGAAKTADYRYMRLDITEI